MIRCTHNSDLKKFCDNRATVRFRRAANRAKVWRHVCDKCFADLESKRNKNDRFIVEKLEAA